MVGFLSLPQASVLRYESAKKAKKKVYKMIQYLVVRVNIIIYNIKVYIILPDIIVLSKYITMCFFSWPHHKKELGIG